jgi:hypothetical protein
LRGFPYALGIVAAVAACSGSDGRGSGLRFAVVPARETDAVGSLRVGVAWEPVAPLGPGGWAVADSVAVEGVESDFTWAPRTTPPQSTRLGCASGSCAQAAVGELVAFIDADGDGRTTLEPTDGSADLSGLSAAGDDRLVGIATDDAVAWASADLRSSDEELLSRLGWPLTRGLQVMRVEHDTRADRLVPPASRERVPIYLIGVAAEDGVCCEPAPAGACTPPAERCPDFRNQAE